MTLKGFEGEGDSRASALSAFARGESKFAAGRAADHPYGVLYQGEYETPWDGTAVAIRLHARALAATGLPVLLRSFTGTVVNAHGVREAVHVAGLDRAVDAELGDLRRTSLSMQVPCIKHAVIMTAEHARSIILPRGAVAPSSDPMAAIAMRAQIGAQTILYTVWERDRVDRQIARELNRCGQLWVPCKQNAEMLIASGVEADKVHVVPHPFDPTDKIIRLPERKPHTHGWRLFYSIGRWEPRKGYAELIHAFLAAFTPKDKVKLTIKYSGGQWKDYPTPREAVQFALAQSYVRDREWTTERAAQRIELVTGRVDRGAIQELHYRNNIYVCSSHGEGFCLPAFEAKLAGNRMVYVPWGGVTDFADISDSDVAGLGFEPVPESYRWGDARWASFEVGQLAAALDWMAGPPERFERPKIIDQEYSMQAVGARMAGLVMKLVRHECPEAARYYETLQNRSPLLPPALSERDAALLDEIVDDAMRARRA